MSSTAGEATYTPTSTSPSNSQPGQLEQQQHLPASTPAATTTAPPPSIPTAQPGSMPPVPAPTAVPAPDQQTLLPTKTTIDPISTTSPPPPQPGAQPAPLQSTDASTSSTTSPQHQVHDLPPTIPPPPKAGDAPPNPQPGLLPTPTGPGASGPLATPPKNTPGTASTYSYNTSYNTPPFPQHPQHPNSTSTPYASVYQAPTPGSSLPLHHHTGSTAMVDSDADGAGSSLFDSAKSWASSAGSKLAEVEAEVWRRINDAHDK